MEFICSNRKFELNFKIGIVFYGNLGQPLRQTTIIPDTVLAKNDGSSRDLPNNVPPWYSIIFLSPKN